MANLILMHSFQFGTSGPFNAGDTISDPTVQAQLQASGAILLDPTVVPGLAALAALAVAERSQGRRRNAEALMSAGYANLIASGQDGVGTIQKRSVAIGFANFAGLAGGVKTFDVNVGAVLPAGARILGTVLEGWTGFDDPGHGTYTVVVGVTVGGNEVGTSASIAAGVSGFPKAAGIGAGGFLGALQSAAQLHARVTGGNDLNTATAGALTVDVFFTVLP